MYIWISRSRSELPLRMCVYKETPANGIHIDDDDVSKKISSNRPVMESNWQKGKFIEHSLSDELVRAFMKCWSLGYLKISTQSSAPIVRVGIWALWWSDGSFSTVFRHDRVHTIYAQFCSACEHWTPATVFIISFRKHACREFNVPLYVYTILAKHFRLQILFTEADQTQTHTHTHSHTHTKTRSIAIIIISITLRIIIIDTLEILVFVGSATASPTTGFSSSFSVLSVNFTHSVDWRGLLVATDRGKEQQTDEWAPAYPCRVIVS